MGQVGKESTLQSILGVTRNIKTFTEIIAKGETTETWGGFKQLVDDGLVSELYPVGSQLIDKWAKAAGTEYDCPWDIVHHHQNGDVELNWHYAYPDGVPFDEPEAIYYAGDEGLPAGTYYITIGSGYGAGWVANAAIYFTLTSDMAAGDQLVINCGTDAAVNPGNGRTWNVYAKGSTTSKQSGTTATSGTGTSLGTIGNTNAHKTNGQLNAISCVVYGSGRWKTSAVRQWLNSSAAAGAWWSAQTPWDRPPSVASTMRGFLAGCSQDFLDILEPVDVVTALNTQGDFATDTETTQDKIYLPCMDNWYINPQYAGEGAEWDYYKALAQEASLTGKFAQGGTYEILKHFNIADHTSSVTVWLRSCYRGNASFAWSVYGSGFVGSNYAYYALRGCPACKIKKITQS